MGCGSPWSWRWGGTGTASSRRPTVGRTEIPLANGRGTRPPVVLDPPARRPRRETMRDRPKTMPAVAYLRRSTERQEQSIGDQRRTIEAFAETHKYHLLDCYTDDA